MIDWIMSLFSDLGARMVFAGIFFFGFVILAGSLVFGGGEHDVDHGGGDHGGGDHDAGHDGHGHGESGHNGHEAPALTFASFLSVRGVALMCVGYGGGAYIIYHFMHAPNTAAIGGIPCAFLFASPALWMIGKFMQQQSSSLVSTEMAVGKIATVTLKIDARGGGEVSLVLSGETFYRQAHTSHHEDIPRGSPVRVVRVLGSVFEVVPVQD
jgi:hypothetical protein